MAIIVYYNSYERKQNIGGYRLEIMEGTPFLVENDSEEDKEGRKPRTRKPGNLGILAIEQSPEDAEPSAFQKAWEATRRPSPEEEGAKPVAEAEESAPPGAEPHVERMPKAEARHIVREMVSTEQQQPEVEDAGSIQPEEASAAAGVEAESPKPAKPVEAEPKPEPEVEIPTIEAEPDDTPETKSAEHVQPIKAEPISGPEPAVEAESPKPEPEQEPEPEDKKPGFIRSLFGRRDKAEEKSIPEASAEEELPKPEVEPPAVEPVKAVEEPAEQEFHFNEQITELEPEPETPEKPKVEEASAEEPPVEELEIPRKQEAKPEQIGHMLLSNEAQPELSPKPLAEAAESSMQAEKKLKIEASPIEPVSGKRLDMLNRAELLKLGEKIEINGNSLKHIHETHLIGERGLRRLIAEHLQGGDLSRALRREITEHERDFERDPVMRDIAPMTTASFDGGKNAALEKLLQRADVSMVESGEQTPAFKAPARRKTVSRHHHFQYRRLLDVFLTLTIATLLLLIIIIYLVRH